MKWRRRNVLKCIPQGSATPQNETAGRTFCRNLFFHTSTLKSGNLKEPFYRLQRPLLLKALECLDIKSLELIHLFVAVCVLNTYTVLFDV